MRKLLVVVVLGFAGLAGAMVASSPAIACGQTSTGGGK
ncbi:hypothetical protein PIN31009_04837 [Pandoraea iniqua]|uniref:Uncharacterized protein n=1 Tax=Pandoraea iniqua TaxID=2508288 RepID=A0A5E4YYA5_9BURK|nr:hypothetical protein PIN31115_00121 [Pandoraea iniqua]VVE53786.1 hypothetical protein PIN31009_04837 [Pandoraea iniqua]